MTNPIGANLVSPGFTRDAMTLPLKAWQPKTIVVNEPDDALWARLILPDAVIGLRLMEGGTDNSYQSRFSIPQWLAKWQPYFHLLRKHRIHAVTGNEPRGYEPQLSTVIDFDTQLAKILAQEEIGGMFCRFPVGHPSDNPADLAKLLPLATAIRAYKRHFLTLNEYAMNTQPILDQRHFVGRFQRVFDAVGPMPLIIGEFSVNTPDKVSPGQQDSWSGWRSSYDGEIEMFIHDMKRVWERVYAPAGVHSMCLFLVGGAQDQQWQNIASGPVEWATFINAMAAYRPALPEPEPTPLPPPPPEPEPEPPIVIPPPAEGIDWELAAGGGVLAILALVIGLIYTILSNVPGVGISNQGVSSTMDIQTFVTIAIGVQAFTEFAKKSLEQQFTFEADQREIIARSIAILAGVVVMTSGELNAFENVARFDNIAGQVLSGIVVGFGSDVTNGVLGVLYNWKTRLNTQAVGHANATTELRVFDAVEPEAEDVAA
jgi:hypothetical protein